MNRSLSFAAVLVAGACCSVSWAADPPVVVKEKVVATQASRDTTRASELMGLELVLENGTSIGVVKDLVMDNASGQVQYVGVVDERGDYRGIPWKTLGYYHGPDVKERYFILSMEPERYLKAPAIPQKEWQTYSWTTYAPQVNKYYEDIRPAKPAAVRRAERRLERKLEK